MYIRDARNREEVWLLDHLEAMGLDQQAFRSRDYVVAVDEETDKKTGFGRLRIHSGAEADVCELTSIGVLDGWRGRGIGAHVLERLVEYAGDEGFEVVYVLAPIPEYFSQFGFEPVDDETLPEVLRDRIEAKREHSDEPIVPLRLAIDRLRIPDRFRERFARASDPTVDRDPPEPDPEAAAAEEFGIDPDEATYKYDPSGRRN